MNKRDKNLILLLVGSNIITVVGVSHKILSNDTTISTTIFILSLVFLTIAIGMLIFKKKK